MLISIVIPTYNEESNISKLLNSIKSNFSGSIKEVLVVDSPSSSDQIQNVVSSFSFAKLFVSPKAGRAAQMNFGASEASGDVLYFVHADAVLPNGFLMDIQNAITLGAEMGCFRFRFDSTSFLLKINSYFTRFSFLWCRGGDQTLFVKKEVYHSLLGFDESYCIMEEYDFIRRAQGKYTFKVLENEVLVSDRKYQLNSYFKVQLANFKAMQSFMKGQKSPEKIKEEYDKTLNSNYQIL